MAGSGGLFAAAAVGIAGALGLAWWSKKQAAQGKSACQSACEAAAKASGVTGDVQALCAASCGILRSVVKPSCPAGSHLDKDQGRLVVDQRGGAGRVSDHLNLGGAAGGAAQAALKAVERITPIFAGVCVDDTTGAIIGTVDAAAKFQPWAPSASSAPPIVPRPDPTKRPVQRDPNRGPQGGVTVT